MANGYSVQDLLDFLAHAAEKGLMPAATAQALSVASRNVLAILEKGEQGDVRQIELDSVIRRFENKRATEFSPNTLREYGNRVKRAFEHFVRWRNDPARFSVKTRATRRSLKRESADTAPDPETMLPRSSEYEPAPHPAHAGGYQTSFPVRAGQIVTLSNVPDDLSNAEAHRLAEFVKMLVANTT